MRNEQQLEIAKKFISESSFNDDEMDKFLSFLFANTQSTLLTYQGNQLLYNVHNKNEIGVYPIDEPMITADILTLARYLEGPFYWSKQYLYIYEPIEICEMNLIGGNVKDFTKLNKSVWLLWIHTVYKTWRKRIQYRSKNLTINTTLGKG